jgi:predicted DCC family thiol-disulfide oxidoreductase YuxK
VQNLVLYDSLCALCNASVRWTLRRDRRRVFAFAALDSGIAKAVLARHPGVREIDSVIVVRDFNTARETLLTRSDGVLTIARTVGQPWRLLARLASAIPRHWRDAGYDVVARHRTALVGRREACALAAAEKRARPPDAL